jgi:hypothetical protein
MARESIKLLMNLDVTDNKRRLMSAIGTLSGWYDVEVKPKRPLRSLRQNSWYHGSIVPALARYLQEQDYENCSESFCHALLKAKFLSRDFVDHRTGDVIARATGSTAKLTTDQFSLYCDRCRHWLQDFFNIVVPDPEPDPARRAARRDMPRTRSR